VPLDLDFRALEPKRLRQANRLAASMLENLRSFLHSYIL